MNDVGIVGVFDIAAPAFGVGSYDGVVGMHFIVTDNVQSISVVDIPAEI